MTGATREPLVGLTERLRERLAKATPGPLKVETQLVENVEDGDAPEVYIVHPSTVCDYTTFATIGRSRFVADETKQANAALIVDAVNALPDFLTALEEQSRRVEEVTAENHNLRKLLAECADDLEVEVQERYRHVADHPAMAHKTKRDLEPVARARTALSPSDTVK